VIFHAPTGLDEAAFRKVQANVRKRILRAFVARGHIDDGLSTVSNTRLQVSVSVKPNDPHIASHARSEGLTLVTNYLGEFVWVPGLLVDHWVESLN